MERILVIGTFQLFQIMSKKLLLLIAIASDAILRGQTERNIKRLDLGDFFAKRLFD